MPNTWIFVDFDNTLMATEQHTVPSLIARFNELYGDKIKSPLTYEIFKQYFHGQARENLCHNLSEYFSISVDYVTLYESREWRIMQYLRNVPHGIEMAPQVIEALTSLRSQHVGLALVSNNSIQRAFTAMRFAQNKQGHTLAALFGTHFFEAGDVQKPKPDVYLRAMAQVNAKPKHSFAVEDSVTGAQAAISAGLTTFGFTGFSHHPEETKEILLEAGCISIFDNWSVFEDCLQEALH